MSRRAPAAAEASQPDGIGSVAIVGTGQVGTMVGLALRASPGGRRAADVALLDRDPSAVEAGLRLGAGDRALTDVAEALGADTLVLALPVPEIVRFLREHGASMRRGSLVLDTGSAKGVVVSAMRECLPAGVHAVGGHPMAGTEGTGPAAARPELLRDAAFVLTPVREDAAALARARSFVRATGARPVEMDATSHDATVARTSHLPHVAAFAVAAAAGRAAAEPWFAPGVAATGYRSATRLANSDPELVASFLSANGAEVAAVVAEVRGWLSRLETELGSTPERLAKFLAEARTAAARVA